MPVTINGSTGLTGVAAIDNVSSTELGYVDGVTSAIQTQLNAKAADSSQGLYYIASSSFTTSSGISINNCFTSTYLNYRLVIETKSASGIPVALFLRLRASGTDLTSGVYYTGGVYVTHGAGPTREYNAAVTSLPIGSIADIASICVVDLTNPNATTYKGAAMAYNGAGSAAATYGTASGFVNVTSAYDGLSLFPASGTMTGSIRVYGYKN